MIKKNMLENIVYKYYPKNVDSFLNRELYHNTNEYKNLISKINDNKNKIKDIEEVILNLKKIDSSFKFDDFTLFEWFDRCYNFQMSKITDNFFVSVNINISLISNFYIVYIKSNKVNDLNRFDSVSNRNSFLETNVHKDLINIISKLIEDKLFYTKFPAEYVDKVIPDINFQDIEMGKFTFYNAFFLNEF